MRFFRYPLLRYRVLSVTIAMFAALWFALPVLSAPATPPDTAPIQGTGTARQDPPGSCSGRPDTITFPATVQIQGGVLYITDPGGQTSGRINADGTAHLTGQGESYDVLSSQGTTLNLREVNGGCNFRTTVQVSNVLPPLAGGAVLPQETAASAPTFVVNAPGGVTVPASGGRSLTWLWGTGIAVGAVAMGGGLFLALRRPVTIMDIANDCPEERERVRRAYEKFRPFWELHTVFDNPIRPQVMMPSDDAWKELDNALYMLGKCLGDPDASRGNYADEAALQRGLMRYGLLPKPGSGVDPVPPSAGSSPGPGFDPVPPTAGSSDEGDERKEIG